MCRPIGKAGLELIKTFEGCRLTAYKALPTEKYWTIGWGHYGADVRQGDTITQKEADAMLIADCQRFANAVDQVENVPLTNQLNVNQRDALISFTFNCGVGNLRTLCKGRTLEQIRDAMGLYTYAGGASLKGLQRRRAAEQALFDTPVRKESMQLMQGNTPDSYAAEAVQWAREKGILKGDLDGNLYLQDACSIQKALVFLWRFARVIGKV